MHNGELGYPSIAKILSKLTPLLALCNAPHVVLDIGCAKGPYPALTLPYPTRPDPTRPDPTLPDPILPFAKGRLMNIFARFLRVERVGGVELTAYPEVRMEIYVCVCV